MAPIAANATDSGFQVLGWVLGWVLGAIGIVVVLLSALDKDIPRFAK